MVMGFLHSNDPLNMRRLNFKTKNRYNFFIRDNLKYLNIGKDLVDRDQSWDKKVLSNPRNSIFT